jgi:hypothetical protein
MEPARPNVTIPASSAVPGECISHESSKRASKYQKLDSQDDQFADPDDDVDPTTRLSSSESIRTSAFVSEPLRSGDIRRPNPVPPHAEVVSVPHTGALCRVCKTTRFHAIHVPDMPATTPAEAHSHHPELVWSTSKSKRWRAINAVLDHCLKAHPHWPLWNALPDVQDGFPSPPRGINVLHRALAVAANALPHHIGDTYGTMDEMMFRVAQRIGLAEGYVNWGPWEFNDQRALQVLASGLLRDYGTSLKMAIRYNWKQISKMSHQDRVDLYNNIFLVPFCIDNLRENGKSPYPCDCDRRS